MLADLSHDIALKKAARYDILVAQKIVHHHSWLVRRCDYATTLVGASIGDARRDRARVVGATSARTRSRVHVQGEHDTANHSRQHDVNGAAGQQCELLGAAKQMWLLGSEPNHARSHLHFYLCARSRNAMTQSASRAGDTPVCVRPVCTGFEVPVASQAYVVHSHHSV